ncbi:MAG: hypothetical protein KDH17_16835 [Rhodocyclaceae bacterium]|nr:hypothetical protein [Rhodocyclaceae bacterium]
MVGVGCRSPGQANDPVSLWRNLVDGRGCIGEMPPERWHAAAHFHPRRNTPASRRSSVAGSSTTSPASMRTSSGPRRARPNSWIPSSECCWKCAWKPSRMPALCRRNFGAPR